MGQSPLRAIAPAEGTALGFSKTKDRAFAAYDGAGRWMARQPGFVRRAGYGALGGVLWAAYLTPGAPVRPTFAALARQTGGGAPMPLFRRWVRQLMLGVDRAERVRHGYGAEIDPLLDIPERARLDALLAGGGVFMAVPHGHAIVPMARALTRQHPVLAIVSLPKHAGRAAAQRQLYEAAGCEFLDARNEPPLGVARTTLKALKAGKIVIGTVDRIRHAPAGPVDAEADLVRALAFGQPVGVGGWPARFARAAGAPVVPAIVEQARGRLVLHLGEAVRPGEDLVAATQDWVRVLEGLLRAHPTEWTFCLDKHWSRVLRAEATAPQPAPAPAARDQAPV
jgi:KDO2-lipid IV(A) lauroyltransferase